MLHIVPVAPDKPVVNLVDTIHRALDGRPPERARLAPLHAWVVQGNVRLVDSIERSEMVIYPSEDVFTNTPAARAAAEVAHASGRTCVFFNAGDSWDPFPLEHGVLYRTSLHRKLARPNERGMPAFVRDVWEESREIGDRDALINANALANATVRARAGARKNTADVPIVTRLEPTTIGLIGRTSMPSVGFCGYVGTPLNRIICLATGQMQKWRGLHLRAKVLRRLRTSKGIRVDVVGKANFGGRATVDASMRNERIEFLRSVLENAYTLCMRGKGNFSFRMYEVLSTGRIPLFVDTDCVLPFEDELDWTALMPWCDIRDLKSIGTRLYEFHDGFDAETFAAHQRKIRQIWWDYLSPLGFMQQLAKRHAVALDQPSTLDATSPVCGNAA